MLPVLLSLLVFVLGQDVIQTTDGPIRGILNAKSRSFLGIPFAAPPVGPLRFENPAPVAKWTAIRNATKFSPSCPQICHLPPLCCPDTQSEDCLYLNVFTPVPTGKLLPVVVFIHGGHYDQGGAGTPLYDASEHVVISQTVVVTMNYRLGVLGFLTTSSGLDGNYAFFDHLAGLKWVHQNIVAFGGDPTMISLVGESAGATSVGALLISPLAKGLFRNAIMQSNPLSIPLADKKDAQVRAGSFLKQLGCKDPLNEIKCVKNASVDSILKSQKATIHLDLEKIIHLFLPWTPVIDGNILPMHQIDAFQKGAWNKMPLVIGTDGDDAIMFIYALKNSSILTGIEYALLVSVLYKPDGDAVIKNYPALGIFQDHRPLMSQLGTDYIFSCPARYFKRLASDQVPVFSYQFNHALSWDGWGPEFAYCRGKFCHAVELPYQFSPPELHKIANWTKEEFMLSENMIRLWSNFAYTSDPNQGPLGPPVTAWPKWSSEGDTLSFETPNNKVIKQVRKKQCDFWDSVSKPYHYGW